ncbi:MAG: sigma-70 family RNA polymerase sigma factor [Sterolibacteriaceae bacterium]|uniref:Sigma-70 family RNA polymerase sigma factor n=1 Tax=Candidatus Methylophosphatis roskildensis TaxID=2899263 RepID=A0A9D7HRQ0_9PROT|nr:sigma-70 family RNA polymerase sigma factor [Candidatus Methylophosphatis roskildensis]MBK7236057.1 sigma-70 family RNA polymerase sigma factor [Sterolibacteriaceae bacterium]
MTTRNTDPDEQRIRAQLVAVERGDQPAMQQLYGSFNRRVFAFALNRLNDRAEAEEVTIDTLLEVWKNPQRFRGESRFSTWLLGIAHHKVVDRLRSRRNDHVPVDAHAELIEDQALRPDQMVEAADQRRMLTDCMDKLPDEQRECLYLVLLEGLSLDEVARIQSCPENTVKTRLFHARQKMKSCLGRLEAWSN